MPEINPLCEAIFEISMSDFVAMLFLGKPLRVVGLPKDAVVIGLSAFHSAYRSNLYGAPWGIAPDTITVTVSSSEFEERPPNTPPPHIEVEITAGIDGDCAGCAALNLQNARLVEARDALSEALSGLADGLERASAAAKQTVKDAQ
ncbi:MAG TPA: hypothetical protein VJQ82_17250 [Terriglobales bacterium]|nr:hypothetical protein [Terriglobales bacterium]